MTVNNLLKHGMEREDIAEALQIDEVDVIILLIGSIFLVRTRLPRAPAPERKFKQRKEI
jgi:hypothetical protein